MIAYSDRDAARIIGKRSADIEALLGFRGRDEMIHRDDLVLHARRSRRRSEPEELRERRRSTSPPSASAEIAAVMDRLGRDAVAAAAVLALREHRHQESARWRSIAAALRARKRGSC